MTFDVAQRPGWYPDSDEPRRLRWWDGSAWTEHTKPRPGIPLAQVQRDNRTYFLKRRHVR